MGDASTSSQPADDLWELPSTKVAVVWLVIAALYLVIVHGFLKNLEFPPDCGGGGVSDSLSERKFIYWAGSVTLAIVLLIQLGRTFAARAVRAGMLYAVALVLVIIGFIVGLPLLRAAGVVGECGG